MIIPFYLDLSVSVFSIIRVLILYPGHELYVKVIDRKVRITYFQEGLHGVRGFWDSRVPVEEKSMEIISFKYSSIFSDFP